MPVASIAEADAVDLIPIVDPRLNLPTGVGIAQARMFVSTEEEVHAAGTRAECQRGIGLVAADASLVDLGSGLYDSADMIHGVEPLPACGPSARTSATFAGRRVR